ncbi:MAG: hypothetical protein HFI86_02200 [Bacilli bacterium]|nr:hypothetical protein [Bacilli bacterium]
MKEEKLTEKNKTNESETSNDIININLQKLLDEVVNLKEELKATKEELNTVKEEKKSLSKEELEKLLEEQKSIFSLSKSELEKMSKEEHLNTKAALDKEPKITTKIPIDELNPRDLVVPVQINGYTYLINRGVTVTIPKSVAEQLQIGGYI